MKTLTLPFHYGSIRAFFQQAIRRCLCRFDEIVNDRLN